MFRISTFLFFILLLGSSRTAYAQDQCGQTAYLEYLEGVAPGINENIEKSFFYALSESEMKTKRS
jgi:hypothetical protein